MAKVFKMRMMALMSKWMISCDKAAFLTSKAQEDRLTFLENIELKMHILSCKYCKRYEKDVKVINEYVKYRNFKIQQGYNGCHLSQEDKSAINDLIITKLKKN